MQPNILIVSENFTRGGLETQIFTTYQALKPQAHFIFAFAHFSNDWDFSDSPIYTNFNFSPTATIQNLLTDTERLVQIIQKHHITAIHAHPFFSLFPTIFASQLTGVPLFYTYHGFGSLNFTNFYNHTTLLNFTFNELLASLFSVYRNLLPTFQASYPNLNVTYLPNALDFDSYPPLEIIPNHEWAYIARLSPEKLDGIFAILDHLDDLEIQKLHFYGDRDCESTIIAHAKSLNLSENRLIFHGHSTHLAEDLNHKYNGIIAMGRAALEALAHRLPVLLAGYGKIFGLITADNLTTIQNSNFAPIFSPNTNLTQVKSELQTLYSQNSAPDLTVTLRKTLDYKTVARTYLHALGTYRSPLRHVVSSLYRDLKNLPDKTAPFAYSPAVTALLNQYLIPQSLDKSLAFHSATNLELSHLEQGIMDLHSEITALRSENASLHSSLNNLSTRLNQLPQGIGLRSIAKNTLRNLKRKFHS